MTNLSNTLSMELQCPFFQKLQSSVMRGIEGFVGDFDREVVLFKIDLLRDAAQ